MLARYWVMFIAGGGAIGLIVADAIAAYKNVSLTFSAITAKWAIRHTASVLAIGLIIGAILGHLFWYQVPTP